MESDKGRAELQAAEQALNSGRYAEADRHLDLAAHAGAEPMHISELGRRLRAARSTHQVSVKSSVRFGFFMALAGYILLSMRQPLGWTIPVWLALAFLVIPGITGLFVGRRHAGERTRVHAFSDGARSGVWAMACYASLHVLVLADRLEKESSQAFDEYLAAFITVIVFSAVAGAVAGGISALASFGKARD